MRIRMTATAKGAVTSTDVREFAEGSEHDLPEDLAEAFLSMGVAVDAAPEEPAQGADDAAATTTPADAPEKPATRKRSGAAKASA